MFTFLFAIAASGLFGSDFSSVCFAIMYLSSQAMSVIFAGMYCVAYTASCEGKSSNAFPEVRMSSYSSLTV